MLLGKPQSWFPSSQCLAARALVVKTPWRVLGLVGSWCCPPIVEALPQGTHCRRGHSLFRNSVFAMSWSECSLSRDWHRVVVSGVIHDAPTSYYWKWLAVTNNYPCGRAREFLENLWKLLPKHAVSGMPQADAVQGELDRSCREEAKSSWDADQGREVSKHCIQVLAGPHWFLFVVVVVVAVAVAVVVVVSSWNSRRMKTY